jgi:hypothetical protein
MSVLAHEWSAILVYGREDTGGEFGRAAAVDQLEDRVKIDPAVLGEMGGHDGRETCVEQSAATPLDNGIGRR